MYKCYYLPYLVHIELKDQGYRGAPLGRGIRPSLSAVPPIKSTVHSTYT